MFVINDGSNGFLQIQNSIFVGKQNRNFRKLNGFELYDFVLHFFYHFQKYYLIIVLDITLTNYLMIDRFNR